MKYRYFALVGLASLALGAIGQSIYNPNAGGSLCSCPDLQPGDTGVSDDYGANGVTNGFITALLASSGSVQWATGCFPIAGGNCVTLQAPGAIAIGTGAQGSALLGAADRNYAMTSTYPWPTRPGGIFITLQHQVVGEDAVTTEIWGDEGADFQRVYNGASGPYVREQWYKGNLITDMRMEIIQNVVRFRLQIRNGSATDSIDLGARFASDVEAGEESRPQFLYTGQGRPIRVDTNIVGANVPQTVEFYNTRSDLVAASRYILAPQAGFEDATRADRIVLGKWFFVMGTSNWEPVLFEDNLINDPALLIFHNPRRIGPGQQIEFVWYVSMVPATVNTGRPVALGTEAEPVLDFDPAGTNGLRNNPTTIYAHVSNQYFDIGQELELKDVSVDISLPPGLALEPGELRTKTIPLLRADQTVSVSWRVRASGQVTGPLTYRVSVSAPPAPSKSVSRTMVIAGTNRKRYEPGFQMISFPFNLQDNLAQVLGLSTEQFSARTWVPERNRYEAITSIVPGHGMWLFMPDTAFDTTLSSIQQVQGTFNDTYTIRLTKGWNQIGNPWVYSLPWGQLVMVAGEDPTRTLTLAEAVNRGIIRGVLYYWDEFSREYKFSSDLTALLNPHRGYWIKLNSNIDLSFPPIFIPGSGQSGTPRSALPEPMTKNNWKLQVVANMGDLIDSQNFIGISPNAQSGVDSLDVEEPPAGFNDLNLSLMPSLESGQGYMQDLRSASDARWEYDFVVRATPGEEVALTWPNARTIGKDYNIRLIDQQTGRAISMGNVAEHRFRASGTDWFKVSIDRRSKGTAVITAMNVSPAGRGVNSVAINYSLSADANAEVRITSTNGKAIATLDRGRSATRGVNTINWNLRDGGGRAVPSGAYMVEVIATTEGGERARAVRPIVVTR
ncbi:MAG: hypothetical protein HUU60_05415 [Armatimonadetes bacterium]|nr:hypothetical protein [Armatimonadota bacterium]